MYSSIPRLLSQRNLGQISTGLPNNPLEPTGLTASAVRTSLNTMISQLLGFLTILAALYFMFQIVIAGYGWITAGGDSGKAAEARTRITNAILGLAIVVAAYTIVGLIASIFGLPVFNPLRYLSA